MQNDTNYNEGYGAENLNPIFSFALPTKIIFGSGTVKELPAALKELGIRKPLIVTDEGVAAAGILERIQRELPGEIRAGVYDQVSPNPKDFQVAAVAAAYKDFGADGLVALGGGSPVDCAKAAGVLIAEDGKDIRKFQGKNASTKPIPPLVTVPTTAGTGSEITFSAVITDTENRFKMTIKNAWTAAKIAVCDPDLTLSVPPAVTASTGMDALTHAIEAYTAACAEPIADAVALYAVELIYRHLPTAFADGNNVEARRGMLMGSLLAGMAFSHSDVASVHCLAEALGGMYDLPHGVCNAVMLPHVMEYNMPCCVGRYARIARAMGLTPDSGVEGAREAVRAVRQLAADVQLPVFLDFHVPEEDFRAIAEASYKNLSTPSNPRPMTTEDYLSLLRSMSKK